MVRRRISEAQRWQIIGMHKKIGTISKIIDILLLKNVEENKKA
jgi:hypothetical protein